MKKLFISVLAIAGLVACSQEQTLVQQGPAPMEFGAAFVEGATRADKAADPSTTTESIKGFDVWGFMDSPAGKVFEGEDVTGSQGNFTYVNTQYWIPGHDYYFAALAPMNSANWKLNTAAANTYGAGIVDFHNVDGTEDLLYAAKMLSTKGLKAGEAPENGIVKLQFSHLLSKVKFTFTNGFDNENAKIDVKNVRMEVPAFASINLAVENWWDNNDWTLAEGKTTLAFGDACANTAIGVKQETANERLTIPADATQKYTVTFDVVFYQGAVVAYEGTKTVTIENVALEMGKAYNFKAELNASNIMADGTELLPIVFDVEEVKDWVTAETPDVNVQEAELRAALLLGGEVTLTKDLEITEPLVVAAGTSSVINLNGKNIINKTKTLEYGKGEGIVVYGDLVINGNGLVKGSTRAVWARGDKGATVTINGGTYEGCEEGYAEGGNSVVYASSGNVVNIYGGTVQALAADKTSYANKTEGVYAALNVADNNGMINVYGGSFYKQNPAAPGTEPAAWNAAHPYGFVAEGYYSSMNGDYYVVNPVKAVATADALKAAIAAGESVKLTADIALAEPVEVTTNAIVDLNGKKITADLFLYPGNTVEEDSYAFWVKNGGELTINGEGEISTAACKYSIAVWAQGGKVTINGGKFTNAGEGSDLIYASANGHVVINGGEFVACKKQPNVDGTQEAYSVLNLKGDNTGSSITCYGGRYFMFDPANNKSENPAVSFVAPGYKSVVDGDYFKVIAQ